MARACVEVFPPSLESQQNKTKLSMVVLELILYLVLKRDNNVKIVYWTLLYRAL